MAVLEGRIAAMNEGDGAAAAAFYTEDGVLEETDLTPHGSFPRGESGSRRGSTTSTALGLRLAPAGAPIAYDRYVAEPTRFYNGNEPGRGAGMLVFEIGAGDKLAYQWMIGWAAGPEETFAITKSPAVDRPNLPPRRVMKVLDGLTAAINRGDGQAAAAYFAEDGKQEELNEDPSLVFKGREAIATRLEELHGMGLRLAPAGAPITYDKYVAEPVRFFNGDGSGRGAGMLVFEFDPAYKIAHEWVIGWADESADGSQAAATGTTTSPTGAGPGEIAFTKGTLSGSLIQEEGIYLVHADGTGLTPLVAEAGARNPAWSPDGTSIAYFDGRGVNVINADGSGKRFVTAAKAWGGWAGWLTWSPDGTQIAFTSYTGDKSDLYVVNADGSARRQLTHGQDPDQGGTPGMGSGRTDLLRQARRRRRRDADLLDQRRRYRADRAQGRTRHRLLLALGGRQVAAGVGGERSRARARVRPEAAQGSARHVRDHAADQGAIVLRARFRVGAGRREDRVRGGPAGLDPSDRSLGHGRGRPAPQEDPARGRGLESRVATGVGAWRRPLRIRFRWATCMVLLLATVDGRAPDGHALARPLPVRPRSGGDASRSVAVARVDDADAVRDELDPEVLRRAKRGDRDAFVRADGPLRPPSAVARLPPA